MFKIEIDEWRQKRLKEMQGQQDVDSKMKAQLEQAQALQEYEQLKRVLFLQILDEKARERLSNIKIANPTYAEQLELLLVQLVQSGQLRSKITEEQLIAFLRKLKGQKKEYRILK